MSAMKCARCGKDPAVGYAGASIGKKSVKYCHPDEGQDCYSLSSAEGYPEITGRKSTPTQRLHDALMGIGEWDD